MEDCRRTTDIDIRITLYESCSDIIFLTFTAAIDVAPSSTALAGCTDGAAIDIHFGIAIYSRFLTAAIDALAYFHHLAVFINDCITIDGKRDVATDRSEVFERYLSVYIVPPIIIGVHDGRTSGTKCRRSKFLIVRPFVCGECASRLRFNHTSVSVWYRWNLVHVVDIDCSR